MKYQDYVLKPIADWYCNELEVVDSSEARYTLTQPSNFLSVDFCTITRFIAVPHSEKDPMIYVYGVSWLGKANPGSVSRNILLKEEFFEDLVMKNIFSFLRGYFDRVMEDLVERGDAA